MHTAESSSGLSLSVTDYTSLHQTPYLVYSFSRSRTPRLFPVLHHKEYCALLICVPAWHSFKSKRQHCYKSLGRLGVPCAPAGPGSPSTGPVSPSQGKALPIAAPSSTDVPPGLPLQPELNAQSFCHLASLQTSEASCFSASGT